MTYNPIVKWNIIYMYINQWSIYFNLNLNLVVS